MNMSPFHAYGLGCQKDPAHRRTQKSSYLLLGTPTSVPASASHETHEAPCLNQGAAGACGGAGTAQNLYTSCSVAGKPLLWTPSPKGIYAVTRQIARAQLAIPGAPLPPLTDSGIIPADLPAALQWGIRAMKGPTPDGRNFDLWTPQDIQGIPNAPPANVNDDEDLAGFEQDGLTVVTGEYRILETASDFVTQMCAALSGVGEQQGGVGCTIGIGAFVDGAVMDWRAGDPPLTTVNFRDSRGGGHWFCNSSYYTQGTKRIFRFINSWGIDYGDRGHFEVTEDWMYEQATQGCDLYPFHVASVAPLSVAA